MEFSLLMRKENNVIHLKEDLMRSFSLSDNSIYSIYQDYEGGIGLEHCLEGVNYLPNRILTFAKYVPGSDPEIL